MTDASFIVNSTLANISEMLHMMEKDSDALVKVVNESSCLSKKSLFFDIHSSKTSATCLKLDESDW